MIDCFHRRHQLPALKAVDLPVQGRRPPLLGQPGGAAKKSTSRFSIRTQVIVNK
jgi:hypothetical protein